MFGTAPAKRCEQIVTGLRYLKVNGQIPESTEVCLVGILVIMIIDECQRSNCEFYPKIWLCIYFLAKFELYFLSIAYNWQQSISAYCYLQL